jgi:hypothetical protein
MKLGIQIQVRSRRSDLDPQHCLKVPEHLSKGERGSEEEAVTRDTE